MLVEFVQPCEIEVYINIVNEGTIDETTESTIEVFAVGDQTEFEILDHPDKWDGRGFVEDSEHVNVQFDDGSVAFCVSTEWYKVISPSTERMDEANIKYTQISLRELWKVIIGTRLLVLLDEKSMKLTQLNNKETNHGESDL